MSVAEKPHPELCRWPHILAKEGERRGWWIRRSSPCRVCCPSSESTCTVFLKLWFPAPLGSHLTPCSHPTPAAFGSPGSGAPAPSVPVCGDRVTAQPAPFSRVLPSFPPQPQVSAVHVEEASLGSPCGKLPQEVLPRCLSLLRHLFTGDH